MMMMMNLSAVSAVYGDYIKQHGIVVGTEVTQSSVLV